MTMTCCTVSFTAIVVIATISVVVCRQSHGRYAHLSTGQRAVIQSGGRSDAGSVKRFWNDDIQPCIERHCVSLLRPDAATNYRACLRKYCSTQMLSYVKKSDLSYDSMLNDDSGAAAGNGEDERERGRSDSDKELWLSAATVAVASSPDDANIVLSVYRPAAAAAAAAVGQS